MVSILVIKATATVTLEPLGSRSADPRDHSVKVAIRLGGGDGKQAGSAYAMKIARASLAGFAPVHGEPDQRKFVEVSATRRTGKSAAISVVVAIEGSVLWPRRPTIDSMEDIAAVLQGEGYRVSLREKRECGEADCKIDAVVDWNRDLEVPPTWYGPRICGRHNYRTCAKCKSVYVLTSSNFVGPAPSVHCAVCGRILIEWGGSKLWSAEPVNPATAH